MATSRRRCCARPDFDGAGGVPEPTETLPGTDDRIEVLRRRVASGQTCKSDDDADLDDDRRGLETYTPATGNNGVRVDSLDGVESGRQKTGRSIENYGVQTGPMAKHLATLPPSFRARLRILRKRKGLSVRVLAVRSALAPATIKNYESGSYEPTVGVAVILALALGVEVCVLIGRG